MKVSSLIGPLIIIAFAVTIRLLPHPANVSPIAALALFGGVYLSRKYALVIPLIAMFISDLFLGFHASMPLVYLGFFLTGIIGIWLSKHKSSFSVVLATLGSSILFYILTNFNYWYATSLYPKTLNGLFQSYFNALPFFRNSLLGDLFYVGLFFGAYELGLRFSKKSIAAKAQ
ncbi:MAG TPA: DUF6580 family putative transport protein [Candidatus Limnocylindrales bacterium]|nr:DUF6580 family putative transport protein [Candidatus Limnocylindrales bacterium]